MKSRRSGVFLMIFGVLLAALAAVMVFGLARQATTAESKFEATQVVVATREIPERTLVPLDALALKRMPQDAVPVGAVTSQGQASGKMATTRIYAGEVILSAKLADTKGQSSLAYLLDKGKVLITFPGSDIISTGAVRQGDTVDILVTLKQQGQGSSGAGESLPATTQTTMQNVKIWSLGSAVPANAKSGSGQQTVNSNLITFALDHQEALLLKALKDTEGMNLELVLRAAGDEEIVKTQPVTLRTIIERYRLRSP